MSDWEDIQRLDALLQRLVVVAPPAPRKPTREEIIDAGISNLAIDRPGMTDEDCRRLKAELLYGR